MASGEEPSAIILEMSDTQESSVKEVHRFHTALASQGTKTPVGVNNSALPIMPGSPYQGKRLLLSAVTDATDIIESEECAATIPLAFVSESTGKVAFVKDVPLEDFTGFKPSASVDVTCTAATKQRVAYFDAPVGYRVALGAGRKYHVYVGDDA